LPILPHAQKDIPTKMRRHALMLRRKGMSVRCISAALPKKHIKRKKDSARQAIEIASSHP
jgi:hypothetical protein